MASDGDAAEHRSCLGADEPPPGYLPTPPRTLRAPGSAAQPCRAARLCRRARPRYTPPPPPPPAGADRVRRRSPGWTVSTDASTFNGNVIIDGAATTARPSTTPIRPGYGVELLYAYVPTHARFASFGSSSRAAIRPAVGLHWIQIGGLVSRPMGRIEPFGALSAGMVVIHASAVRFQDGTSYDGSDTVRFAFTAGLGFKVWLTESIGLRLRGPRAGAGLLQRGWVLGWNRRGERGPVGRAFPSHSSTSPAACPSASSGRPGRTVRTP